MRPHNSFHKSREDMGNVPEKIQSNIYACAHFVYILYTKAEYVIFRVLRVESTTSSKYFHTGVSVISCISIKI